MHRLFWVTLGFVAGALVFRNNPVKAETVVKQGETLGTSLWDKFLALFKKG